MLEYITEKINETVEALKLINYKVEGVSAQEFYDYMTGEIFSEDTTTLEDVLGNEYLMVHELIEINELKKMGRTINKRVIVESPKTVIYEAHLTAMELELEYALRKKDCFWAKIRLRHHKESVLDDDPNLPQQMRPRAETLYTKFKEKTKTRNSVELSS